MAGQQAVILCLLVGWAAAVFSATPETVGGYTLQAGHPSLQAWLLPDTPSHPPDNPPTAARIALGKKLFFDPRLSRNGDMSCATCHQPERGWSDGLPLSIGFNGQILTRATPTIINSAYNNIFMWDGRADSLESQALGPIQAPQEMNMDMVLLIAQLKSDPDYLNDFATAYPEQGVTPSTIGKALASFERTVVSLDTPFDQWVRGNSQALTPQQVLGFNLFLDPEKGNCAACHNPPHFSDDGFHNVGLSGTDPGRYQLVPVSVLKGAFKTPSLRELAYTAPYFHDGSATTLSAVIEHYIHAGDAPNISPSMKRIRLTNDEQAALSSFLEALSTPHDKANQQGVQQHAIR